MKQVAVAMSQGLLSLPFAVQRKPRLLRPFRRRSPPPTRLSQHTIITTATTRTATMGITTHTAIMGITTRTANTTFMGITTGITSITLIGELREGFAERATSIVARL